MKQNIFALPLVRLSFIIIPMLLAASCKKKGGADFARNIPPHYTRPIAVFDMDKVQVEYERYTYHWDTGTLEDETEEGTTDILGIKEMVCHDTADLARHTAWVRRMLPITVKQVLQSHGVELEKQDAVARTVEAILDHYLTVEVPPNRTPHIPDNGGR